MRDALREHLKVLLEALEVTGKRYEELYDSEVREAMGAAIALGFITPEPDYSVPTSFGMHCKAADTEIQVALTRFIRDALPIANGMELNEAARLRAFQDGDVHTDGEQQYFDDFFGWTPDER